MKRLFIINPNSGRGLAARNLKKYETRFAKSPLGFHYVMCSSREEAINQTQKALREGTEQIVAVGGDGTLNSVLNGFFENGKAIHSDATLIVGAVGTGCDYYRNIAGDKNWLELVENYREKRVDVGEIRFLNSQDPTVYFINMASVGLSAFAVAQQKKLPSFLPPIVSYAGAALSSLCFLPAANMKIKTDQKTWEGSFLNVFAAKGKTAGGGMRLGGKVCLVDGNLDVTIIPKVPLWRALRSFPRLFSGNLEKDPLFIKTITSHLEITSDEKINFECDGELLGTTDIQISVLPQSVKIAFPVDANAILTKI